MLSRVSPRGRRGVDMWVSQGVSCGAVKPLSTCVQPSGTKQTAQVTFRMRGRGGGGGGGDDGRRGGGGGEGQLCCLPVAARRSQGGPAVSRSQQQTAFCAKTAQQARRQASKPAPNTRKSQTGRHSRSQPYQPPPGVESGAAACYRHVLEKAHQREKRPGRWQQLAAAPSLVHASRQPVDRRR